MEKVNENAYFLAIRHLQYRPRSIKEIKDYLRKKKVPDADIEKTVPLLLEQKFLDDEAFARMWINTRTLLRPMSQRLLRLELKQKGIAQSIIEDVIAKNAQEKGNDLEMARMLLEKRKQKFQNMSREELLQKAGGFLGRRGFNYDTIKRTIDDVFGNVV